MFLKHAIEKNSTCEYTGKTMKMISNQDKKHMHHQLKFS